MTHFISFTKKTQGILALSLFAFVSMASIADAAASTSASKIPSCTIEATPSSITSTQSTTLKWVSTEGALFASLDNNIGSTAPDGKITVSPNKTTIYTLHTWNSRGEGGYCSTTVSIVGGVGGPIVQNPIVSVQTLAIHPAATRIVLNSVPYTGPVEDAIYSFFLLALMLTAGYVVTTQRKTLFS